MIEYHCASNRPECGHLQPIRRLVPRLALHRNELLVIYAMVTVASALCGHDLVQVVTPQIITPFWLATPENRWEELAAVL